MSNQDNIEWKDVLNKVLKSQGTYEFKHWVEDARIKGQRFLTYYCSIRKDEKVFKEWDMPVDIRLFDGMELEQIVNKIKQEGSEKFAIKIFTEWIASYLNSKN